MAADMINLAAARIIRSPDVRSWPATAEITAVHVTPTNVRFDFTKKDGPGAWPPQPFGDPKDGGNCQYTAWCFINLSGEWTGAGFVQLWQGRDGVGDSISDFVNNWWDPRGFWGPMTGHVVQPGEVIAFMLTAGNARLDGVSSVQERSNVVTIAAPAGDVGDFTFGAVVPVPPAPAPLPPPPGPGPADFVIFDKIADGLVEVATQLQEVAARIDSVQKNGVPVRWR